MFVYKQIEKRAGENGIQEVRGSIPLSSTFSPFLTYRDTPCISASKPLFFFTLRAFLLLGFCDLERQELPAKVS